MSEEFVSLAERIISFVDDQAVLARLAKQAVAETILRSYRQRFYARLPLLLNMERADFERAAVGMPSDLKESVQNIRDQIDEALANGDAEKAAELKHKAANREEKLREALGRRRASALATGQFRRLALEVIAMMASVEAVDVHFDKKGVRVGIGRLAQLETIETPSATSFLTGNDTKSKKTSLWRHLEFGTGIYATGPGADASSKFKESDGSWWFGPKRGRGLHLKGSQGAHAIFDKQAVMYGDDAMRFEKVFAQLLSQALGGISGR